MKKTIKYLKSLTDEELRKLIEPINHFEKAGNLPADGEKELIALAEMLRKETGLYDIVGIARTAIKDEVCRRFVCDAPEEKEAAKPNYEPTKQHDLIGRQVIVYDRYLFAVPVTGVITNISSSDGAYQVIFDANNPGGQNVIKHDGEFFLPEQCRLTEKEIPEKKPSHEPGKYKPESTIDSDDPTNEYWEFWLIGTEGAIFKKAASGYKKVEAARALGICCKTKGEAEQVWERMKLKQKILDRIAELNKDEEPVDWGDTEQMKYFFRYDHSRKKLATWPNNFTQIYLSSYYSTSEVIMEQIREEFGDEAIIDAFQLNS